MTREQLEGIQSIEMREETKMRDPEFSVDSLPDGVTTHEWIVESTTLSDGSKVWDVIGHDFNGDHRVRIACPTYHDAETLCVHLTKLSIGFEIVGV